MAGAIVRRTVDEAAEGLVEALTAYGVEHIFLNPGTDTFPIQEALAKLAAAGRTVPRTVLCIFETVALAAAHGYYAATGRAQAVLVHVDVGTQNLGGMLHNAQRGRAAVLVMAGRAPYTTDPARRGARDSYIHWLQEQMDQHGIVRNYVKWDYELRRSDQVGEALARGLQIARSDPPGPVYLTLPRELLMDPVGEVALHRPDRFPPVALGAGDPAALAEAARALLAAERPLVIAGNTGRTAAGYHALIELAQLLGLPVVEWRERASFPLDHPLHQGADAAPLIEDADVVLALDVDVPYIPTRTGPPADAIVVQIDRDPVKERVPLWTFPLSQAIRADTAAALPLIVAEARRRLAATDHERIEARRHRLADRHRAMRARWDAEAEADATATPITPVWLSACLGSLLREAPDCLVVDETVTNSQTLWRYAAPNGPESWYVSGGSGLGWALGAALG
ncbi:MAG: thiamine pyrophosphate-requiring protein [Dehalococcoidia bacterium]